MADIGNIFERRRFDVAAPILCNRSCEKKKKKWNADTVRTNLFGNIKFMLFREVASAEVASMTYQCLTILGLFVVVVLHPGNMCLITLWFSWSRLLRWSSLWEQLRKWFFCNYLKHQIWTWGVIITIFETKKGKIIETYKAKEVLDTEKKQLDRYFIWEKTTGIGLNLWPVQIKYQLRKTRSRLLIYRRVSI